MITVNGEGMDWTDGMTVADILKARNYIFPMIAVQVNGKLRSKIEVPFDITAPALKDAIFSDAKIKPWIQDKEIKDIIIIPKKLVNIVLLTK